MTEDASHIAAPRSYGWRAILSEVALAASSVAALASGRKQVEEF